MVNIENQRIRDLQRRISADSSLRDRLLSDPRTVLADEAGVAVPLGVKIVVVEDTADIVHLVLPPRLSDLEVTVALADEQLSEASGGGGGIFNVGFGFQGGFGGMMMGKER